MDLTFRWDPEKDRKNQRDHHVSFAEARTAFAGALSIMIPDPAHSVTEARYLLIGQSRQGVLLVFAHVDEGDEIQIISARAATRRERYVYEEEA